MYTLQNVQWVSVSMDWETRLILLFLYFITEGVILGSVYGVYGCDTFQKFWVHG